MAEKRICAVEGCGKVSHARGWCCAHYDRWYKHGDPLAGRTSNGAPGQYLRDVVLEYVGADCLIWPFNRAGDGRARLMVGKKCCHVARIVCEQINGQPPTPRHEAAHSCGHGHLGCVAPLHLNWKTPTENNADKLIHGTHNRGERCGTAKLTVDSIQEIRNMLMSGMSAYAVSRKYDVNGQTILRIKRGETWAWLD